MNVRSLAPPIAVMLLILTAATVVHGIITDRFGMVVSQQLQEFTARLDDVPRVIGDWESTEANISPEEIERANVTGHISRVYTHRETGASVNMFLVCGTSRHITLHTPDRCYRAQGFDPEAEPTTLTLDAGMPEPLEFADGRFYKEEGHKVQRLRILWAFSDDGVWRGPRSARTALAGRGALFKLYLIAPVGDAADTDIATPPLEQFATAAMPVIRTAIFSGEKLD